MGPGLRSGQTVSSIPFGFDRQGRPLRVWRRRKDLSVGEGLRYPLVDGPGIALLVLFPPFLAIMALPVFDMMVRIKPENALSPINLLIVPFSLPLIASFSLTTGYILIFLGRVLSTSAWGQEDHPNFPIWDRLEILEELARWLWAGSMGLMVGGSPAFAYWKTREPETWPDLVVLAALGFAGMAYAQMALMTALLHDSLAAANPVTVVRSVARIGRGYVGPCLVVSLMIGLDLASWTTVLLHSPSPTLGLVGLWACWVFTLYVATMTMRLLGTVYYRHEAQLAWFRTSKG